MEFDLNFIIVKLMELAVPVVVGLAVKFVRDHGLIKKFEAKKGYAKIAIQFVEQVANDLNAEQKYHKAADYLSNQLNEAGIKYSDNEIEALIESAVNQFKSEFKQEINQPKQASIDPGSGGR